MQNREIRNVIALVDSRGQTLADCSGHGEFLEFLHQCTPLTPPDVRDLDVVARMLVEISARPKGLTLETARQLITQERDLTRLVLGPQGKGTAAEIVAKHDDRLWHLGLDSRIVNPPKHTSSGVLDMRLCPDISSKRDALWKIRAGNHHVWRPGPQYKVGTRRYVSDKLSRMRSQIGYGFTAGVDARFVNPDGSPRIAEDGFTSVQAANVEGINLRGYLDLEVRSEQLRRDVALYLKDGLTPLERALRNAVRMSYRPRQLASRALVSASVAAGTTALISAASQAIETGKVDGAQVVKHAATAAAVSTATVVAEKVIYTQMVKTAAPAIASQAAKTAVARLAVGISIASDVVTEVSAVNQGTRTPGQAAGRIVGTTALNVASAAMVAPLGPFAFLAIPIFQFLGRKFLSWLF